MVSRWKQYDACVESSSGWKYKYTDCKEYSADYIDGIKSVCNI